MSEHHANNNGQMDRSIAQNNHLQSTDNRLGLAVLARPGINHCEASWKWMPPPFDDFDLWVVLAGRGALFVGKAEYQLQTGSCVIFQPGDVLSEATHDASDPLVVFYCHFVPKAFAQNARQRHDRRIAQKLHRFCEEFIHVEVGVDTSFRQNAELVAEVFDQGESGRRLATMTVAQIVAYILFIKERPRQNEVGDSLLSKLAMDIRSRPGSTWNLKNMAARCAISRPHFNRRFRQTFGHTPIQYVIRQRVFRATTLLQESDLSIKQIAAAVGYSDVFYFHRQFRQIVGTTPRIARMSAGRHAATLH